MSPFTIDREGLRVFDADGKDLSLTFTEYRLLVHFVDNAGRAYNREMLLDKFWSDKVICDRGVDRQISALRKKVPGFRERLAGVYGFGWRYDSKS